MKKTDKMGKNERKSELLFRFGYWPTSLTHFTTVLVPLHHFYHFFCFLKESHDKNNWWCLHRIRLPDCTSPHTHTHLKRHTPSIYREILKIREKWSFCSNWPTMTISYSFLFVPTWSIRFEENCFFEKISRKCFKKFKIAFWNWLFRKNSSK